MRVALEMVPTSTDMLGNDIPQGIVGHTSGGETERVQFCSMMT